MIKKVMAWILIGSTLALGSGFAGVTEHFKLTNYKIGTVSQEVYWLQRALSEAGVYKDLNFTLNYNLATQNAVNSFQKSAGLTVDGIAGKVTLEKLEALNFIPEVHKGIYKPGSQSKDVYWIQKALIQLGLLEIDKPTDYYGTMTQEAVKAFQKRFQLEADGIAGEAVLAKLSETGHLLLSEPETSASGASTGAVFSRGVGERRVGEYVSWYDIQGQLKRGETVLTLEDFKTGATYQVKVTYGGVHADVEPLTKADSETIKKLWGGAFSWERRAILVHFNNRVIAASMNGMPHAGVETQPEGKYISGRSAGYGYGYNFDAVKNNGVSGHFCLHFKDSKLHSSRTVDAKHQAMIKLAAGVN